VVGGFESNSSVWKCYVVDMDGMLNLFETVAHSDCHNVLLQTFLKTCTEHQAFVTKVRYFHCFIHLSRRTALTLGLFV
jgi:hypothetical protein